MFEQEKTEQTEFWKILCELRFLLFKSGPVPLLKQGQPASNKWTLLSLVLFEQEDTEQTESWKILCELRFLLFKSGPVPLLKQGQPASNKLTRIPRIFAN